MKGKIVSVSLLAVLMLSIFALPFAVADPTKGQKEPITIVWLKSTTTSASQWMTPSGVVHRTATLSSNLEIYIGAATTPLKATAVETRYAEWNQEDLTHRSCHRNYVITIPAQGKTEAGGFEGNSKLQIFDYVTTPVTSYNAFANGLFHGFGANEGQTINAGDDWGLNESPIVWTGYILKP
jgi:hypothetical protein